MYDIIVIAGAGYNPLIPLRLEDAGAAQQLLLSAGDLLIRRPQLGAGLAGDGNNNSVESWAQLRDQIRAEGGQWTQ